MNQKHPTFTDTHQRRAEKLMVDIHTCIVDEGYTPDPEIHRSHPEYPAGRRHIYDFGNVRFTQNPRWANIETYVYLKTQERKFIGRRWLILPKYQPEVYTQIRHGDTGDYVQLVLDALDKLEAMSIEAKNDRHDMLSRAAKAR